jgi:uncharacterized protein
VVKPGDVVRVKVLDVDVARKRIGLTLRLDDEPGARAPARKESPAPRQRRERGADAAGGSMADALRRAGFKN